MLSGGRLGAEYRPVSSCFIQQTNTKGLSMAEVNLLRRYPAAKRNVQKRAHAKTEEHVRISREYGFDYFDGSREYGYGLSLRTSSPIGG